MKILLPYMLVSNNNLSSKHVTGGVERFSQLIYKNISNVIPVYIEKDDKDKKRKIVKAARENNVDIIISNYEQTFGTINLQKDIPDIPIMVISHLSGAGLGVLGYNANLINFADAGGAVFMVSKDQYNRRNVVANRTLHRDLKVSGFINSAFCTGNETVNYDIEYTTLAVGRISKSKNIFWVHKKSQPLGVHSLVITGKVKEYISGEEDYNYYIKNKNWVYPQETKFDLEHSEVLNHFSRSGVYVSTCTVESFGITALEALSCGCSIALITDSSEHHSSEIIPAHHSHYCNIKSSISLNDFAEMIKKYTFSYEKRVEISEMTKEKHSKEKWCQSIKNAIDFTIEKFKKPTSLFDNF